MKMWHQNSHGGSYLGRKSGRNGLVAVAIDKDKGSQHALKWATENLMITKGQTVILIHVVQRSTPAPFSKNYAIYDVNGVSNGRKRVLEKQTKELFLSFHCFCTRKDINCHDVVLEDTDVARAITDYVAEAAIENLVLGASRHGFIKLKMVDIPNSVSKAAPDFCTVYVISKTKISSVKNASRVAPFVSPLLAQLEKQGYSSPAEVFPKPTPKVRDRKSLEQVKLETFTISNFWKFLDECEEDSTSSFTKRGRGQRTPPKATVDDTEIFKSPFTRGRGFNGRMFAELSEPDMDISFVSSDRASMDRISTEGFSGRTSRASTSSESSLGSRRRGSVSSTFTDFSTSSVESDDAEAEMRRLKLELQKTMEMYSSACKDALSAKQKAVELHQWRIEEERRMEEAQLVQESARLSAAAKHRTAPDSVEAAQRIAEMESQRRLSAEMKALQSQDKISSLDFRRYTIEEIEEATQYFSASLKVGEGGYGPVFRCYLHNTHVAVKVLRPDAAQGRSQFQQEVQVLSCMRHPNMVLLIGACPEYGCLVYEYMANGSLEDCLCRKGNMRPLSWQLRFRIASEIATGLNFLHQMKPEPLVHRDLKPANILLNHNYISKISDVGLARLVPPNVADDVTQYRMTSAAGTFCYIDPEYQQTGMLGVKSDVYSFGVVLLQILTAKPAMGLTHTVARAMEKGKLVEMLDPTVPDWPIEEAGVLASLALRCAELRRKDRPDLGKVVLPELNRLREFGDERFKQFLVPENMSGATG